MLDLPISNIGTLPGLELQIIQDKILLFLFCSIRISAFLISSPIFGAGYVLLPAVSYTHLTLPTKRIV